MIHNTDPFAAPEPARSPVRRLRGRLAQTVTLWTAYASPRLEPGAEAQAQHGPGRHPAETTGRAGLTVSSCLIADGEPGRVIGLIDDESDLWTAISASGKFAISVLSYADQQLADRFAGLLPAPGGLFKQGDQWADTGFGPVTGGTWAGCRLDASRTFGWSLLVEGTIEEIEFGAAVPPLLHHSGSYRQLGGR